MLTLTVPDVRAGAGLCLWCQLIFLLHINMPVSDAQEYSVAKFDAAQAHCRQNGSQLASPGNVQYANRSGTFWLPIKRMVGVEWEWFTEQDKKHSHQDNWMEGHPKEGLDCVVMIGSDARWRSADCNNESHAFICTTLGDAASDISPTKTASPLEAMKTQIIIGVTIVVVTVCIAIFGLVFTVFYSRRRVRKLEANCVTKRFLPQANGHAEPTV